MKIGINLAFCFLVALGAIGVGVGQLGCGSSGSGSGAFCSSAAEYTGRPLVPSVDPFVPIGGTDTDGGELISGEIAEAVALGLLRALG